MRNNKIIPATHFTGWLHSKREREGEREKKGEIRRSFFFFKPKKKKTVFFHYVCEDFLRHEGAPHSMDLVWKNGQGVLSRPGARYVGIPIVRNIYAFTYDNHSFKKFRIR